MDARSIRHAIREAETLGVKEICFTGREPFLHPEILPLLTDSLAVAPTSVLTNGTRIDVRMAAALARLAGEAAFEAGAPSGTRRERSSSSRREGSSPL
jgi:molybdenum cofactor biosynthesis enzyme MoaA